MTDTPTAASKSIVVEREMPHPAEKIWRALTTPALIADWLMENDFEATPGHRFQFRAKPMPGWTGVTNCEVIEIDPPRRLAYRWGDGTESESGLKTIVTWTLTPIAGGTLVRMEQSGFRPEDEAGYRGMSGGWPHILAGLEQVGGAA
jgi:uncharacterized protein YndB with AHSA1/START domain